MAKEAPRPAATSPPDSSGPVAGARAAGAAELLADIESAGPDPSEEPSGARMTAGGSARAVAVLEVALCSGFPTQLLLAAALGAIGLQATGARSLSFIYVVALSLADAVLVLGLIGFFLRARGETMRELALGSRSARAEARLGLALVPALVVAVIAGTLLLGWLAPGLRNVPENPFESLLDTPGRVALFALVAIVAGGIREELQRAFVLRRFEQHLGGGWIGLVLFSTAFGLGHQIQGWDAAILTGLLGAGWGAIYLIRRSAVAPMVSHAGFNTAEILLALAAAGG